MNTDRSTIASGLSLYEVLGTHRAGTIDREEIIRAFLKGLDARSSLPANQSFELCVARPCPQVDLLQFARIVSQLENLKVLYWRSGNREEIAAIAPRQLTSFREAGAWKESSPVRSINKSFGRSDFDRWEQRFVSTAWIDNSSGIESPLRAFVGLPFDGRRSPNDPIHDIAQEWTIVPSLMLVRQATQFSIVLILTIDADKISQLTTEKRKSHIVDRLDRLFGLIKIGQVQHHSSELLHLHSEIVIPEHSQWDMMVRRVKREIESGTVDKVVLSRQRKVPFSGTSNTWDLVERLATTDKASTTFAVMDRRSDGTRTFLGSTPELLFRRDGERIQSECLAGTRARGANRIADDALSRELRESAKDRAEHNYVVEGVTDALRSICRDVTVIGRPRIRPLSTVQHLVSGAEGTLRDHVGVGTILNALHPTPAVGGLPRVAAMDLIRELEPENRGLYAGPVGWFSLNRSEFSVAIRCALIEQSSIPASGQITVYAGAGIVADSDAEMEWQETQQKSEVIMSHIRDCSNR